MRPISLAVDHAWPLRALLRPAGVELSRWAAATIDRADTELFDVAPDLLAELGERDASPEHHREQPHEQSASAPPELVAVGELPPDDLARIPVAGDALVLALDRPGNPGNIGTLVRTADAFGLAGVVVTGHAADPYDPRAVRASTGSLFAVPVVRIGSPRDVVDWARGAHLSLVGTDEAGTVELPAYDFVTPERAEPAGGGRLVVIGNETRGMSRAWQDACDTIVRIPIGGAASSLNAATAGSIMIYEAIRQRRAGGLPAGGGIQQDHSG